MALIEVRLRPTGPWRVGHHAGDRERVDVVYHSDALFSAVTHAMRALGWLEEWLGASSVRFSSLFPFIGKTRLIAPPKTAWPPANPGKLYLHAAKLVPLEVARNGVVDESRWSVDGGGECLVPAGAGAPFHVSMRSAAAVDRLTGATEPHRVACLEFASNAGWWGVFETADKLWEGRVKSAFRLLADSGFGGERSRGWGRAGAPEFSDASGLFPREAPNGMWWLLSLYSPAPEDTVDWSKSEYTAATKGGWTDSPSGTGAKKQVRMIEEGSVLSAEALRGRKVDVAPEGFPHPVYRSGIALAIPLPTPEKIAPQPDVAQAFPPVLPPEPVEEAGEEQALPPVHEPEGIASDVAQAFPPVQATEPVEEAGEEQAVPPVHENEAVAPSAAEQPPVEAPQPPSSAQATEPDVAQALPPAPAPEPAEEAGEEPVVPPVHGAAAVESTEPAGVSDTPASPALQAGENGPTSTDEEAGQ